MNADMATECECMFPHRIGILPSNGRILLYTEASGAIFPSYLPISTIATHHANLSTRLVQPALAKGARL